MAMAVFYRDDYNWKTLSRLKARISLAERCREGAKTKMRQIPDKNALQKRYEADFPSRELIVKELETRLEKLVSGLPSNLTIKGRVKSFESFFNKYLRYLKDVPNNNLPVIPDQIGIRVVCPFIEDTVAVEKLVKSNFKVAEVERKGSAYSFKEFGYESIHFLVQLPAEIGDKYLNSVKIPFTGDIIEIQIRTILQDAWAEVEHELVYKAEFRPFDHPMKRKLAAINASLSLADTIFQEIRTYQRNFNKQLGHRKDTFFKKVEEAADAFLFDGIALKRADEKAPVNLASDSIDDLLLNALYAHNRGLFSDATSYYSAILNLKPDVKTTALIYKHRGMAFFAQSRYNEAIEDFSQSLKLDEKSYQAAYYCGVVRLVLQQYAAAIEDFDTSIAINRYQSYCFYRRAEAYYHLKDYPQALADCEASLALAPELDGASKLKLLLLNKLKM
ncbi:MAG: tetratricopeptide repeat protein [Spirochaetaceae bacterium]|jgi:putative GTP pyrophosphokinase|nr:tetratricopeptide repeat protein [Spirochaetaceae bacterium]